MIINGLHPLFAAEIIGMDVRDPSPSVVEAVNAAMAKYAVVVIRRGGSRRRGRQRLDWRHVTALS